MFEVSISFMILLSNLIVPIISIYILFDLLGSLLFGK